ncbi:tetratricopeptide repeat protein [Pandoraea anhela]|uniref:Uncharacterized protein n=1 Tax=Pandoraea anhela TaxID=2508295 RepID=A0A5E4S3U4_9BURK|nr:hypothetical protein [Pandoraea anhela]VVD70065.1 hypothetical protein PAN31108_00579 [Pandoraea anhela]
MTRTSIGRRNDVPPAAFARRLPPAPGVPTRPSRSINGPVDAHALAHAYALHAANDLEGAAQAFASICSALPENADAYKAFGYVLCQLGDYEHAITPLIVAVAREYGNPEPLYFAALCMHQTGDIETAREMAVDALEMARSSHHHAGLQDNLTRLLRLLDGR